MKLLARIVAVLAILTGIIWFLQGINVLPGSVMTGRPEWSIYGIIAILSGVVLMLSSKRIGRKE